MLDIGPVPIGRKVLQFNFTIENALMHEVIMHLYVLSVIMENWVLCKLEVSKVVKEYCHKVGNLYQQIL